MAARCEYHNKANADRMLKRLRGKSGGDGDEGGDGEEDEEDEEEEDEEEDEEDEEAENALEDDLEVAGNADKAPPGIDHVYGSVVDTGVHAPKCVGGWARTRIALCLLLGSRSYPALWLTFPPLSTDVLTFISGPFGLVPPISLCLCTCSPSHSSLLP